MNDSETDARAFMQVLDRLESVRRLIDLEFQERFPAEHEACHCPPMHLTQENFDELHIQCSTLAAKVAELGQENARLAALHQAAIDVMCNACDEAYRKLIVTRPVGDHVQQRDHDEHDSQQDDPEHKESHRRASETTDDVQ